MIALNKWFAAHFLFAIDERFQRWLIECKQAQISRANVNDRIIDFSNVIELVLNGTFTMPLPPSFQGINSKAAVNKRSGDGIAKEDSKKKKKSDKKEKQEELVVVKNEHHYKSFKMNRSKTWKRAFKLIAGQAGTARRQRKCALNGILMENIVTTVTGKRVVYQRMISRNSEGDVRIHYKMLRWIGIWVGA